MKLLRLSGREVVKILAKHGFQAARQKGSHLILVKESESGKKAVVVPNHAEIDKGTLLEILRQSGLTRQEFFEMIK